ncbi:uncharacterized protein LOC131265287 [Anopheles coustani]|uniref:uncharacterized protein LOC131265287 n=1 Tax=Anopheles coustani TaxID=139045 RepID=UPI0026588A6E|nr:uncharacterized protein LOC131265287 [Anopheles coustani]
MNRTEKDTTRPAASSSNSSPSSYQFLDLTDAGENDASTLMGILYPPHGPPPISAGRPVGADDAGFGSASASSATTERRAAAAGAEEQPCLNGLNPNAQAFDPLLVLVMDESSGKARSRLVEEPLHLSGGGDPSVPLVAVRKPPRIPAAIPNRPLILLDQPPPPIAAGPVLPQHLPLVPTFVSQQQQQQQPSLPPPPQQMHQHASFGHRSASIASAPTASAPPLPTLVSSNN